MTQWNLSIPDETDREIRAYLAQNGEKTEDLSEFVNRLVCRFIFEKTVSEIKDKNQHYDQDEIMAIVDREVEAVRKARS